MRDYKFQSSLDYGQKRSRTGRLLFLLPLLAMGASGLYAAFNIIPSQVDPTDDAITASREPLKLPLPLPSQATRIEPGNIAQLQPDKSPLSKSTLELQIALETPITIGSSLHTGSSTPSNTGLNKPHTLPISTSSTTAPATISQVATATDVSNQDRSTDKWLEHMITPGDTLAKIFSDMQLSSSLLHKIVHSSKKTKRLEKIKPGQKIRIRVDAQNTFQELVYEMQPARSLSVVPSDNTFASQVIERPIEHRTSHVSGTIRNSLFLSAQNAGLSDAKTMELANIFAWDIDFALEIRTGDQFTVLYQENYLDGKKLGDGPILAAEFVNRGKSYRALRYEDKQGHGEYYTPDGNSIRKAFLRMPVKFARISSRFNPGRKHPILNRIRAHKGVDYAAAKGTPVRASGDGKIAFKGRKGGYGKTLVLEHGGGISTLYAHLSRYSKRAKQGSRVRQGQVIGYIGQTGLATGPHLHYEFRLNGVHRNPLTVKLPAAKPIAKSLRADFERQTQPLVAQLTLLAKTMVANAE